MRKLYRFKEAAERFYGGDEESLRHALLLGVVRAKVELCDIGEWVWWVDSDEPNRWVDMEPHGENPKDGSTQDARWKPKIGHKGSYELVGWFVLDRSRASKIAHGRFVSDLLLSVDEEEECFLGLTFRVNKPVDLADMWFEPSDSPERVFDAQDEALDEMAESVAKLTDDPTVVARFEAAANAGADGLGPEALTQLQRDFGFLQTTAVIEATLKRARAPQSKGGKAKAAKTAEAKSKVLDAWAHIDKRGRGMKTRFTTAQAALYGVSPRTIEAWLK